MHHPPPNTGSNLHRKDYAWQKVAKVVELGKNSAMEIIWGKSVIALFNQEGTIFAMDGMCSHQGGPIAQGTVDNNCVTCPWHGWQYELDTGIQTINRQPLQECFDVREVDGWIEIFIGEQNES